MNPCPQSASIRRSGVPPELPTRGTVLTVLGTSVSSRDLESAIARRGMTLLRATHGIHAAALARHARPDLIVVEVLDSMSTGSQVLATLSRHPKTADIPVLALIDTAQQDCAAESSFRHATTTMVRTDSPDSILACIEAMLATARPTAIRRVDPAAERVDAVFSELGARRLRSAAKRFRRPALPPGNIGSSSHWPHSKVRPPRTHLLDAPSRSW